MCRLYGLVANEPTRVECSLERAQNALVIQSRLDSQGVRHHDGWGIAYYANAHPTVKRRCTAAGEDLRFEAAAKEVFARIVVAHVRAASIGGATKANTHPFQVGRWVFAHNGTIPAFDRVAPLMEAEIAPGLLEHRYGTTDSELVFLWILTRLTKTVPTALSAGAGLSFMVTSVAEVIHRIDRWWRAEDGRPGLNFILTDGTSLVASRFHNTLHWILREKALPCEVCDTCHCRTCAEESRPRHKTHSGYRAVVIASEPITEEPWREVPEGYLLAVDEHVRVELSPIGNS